MKTFSFSRTRIFTVVSYFTFIILLYSQKKDQSRQGKSDLYKAKQDAT